MADTPSDLPQRLEAAFNRLPVLPERQPLVPRMVETLLLFAGSTNLQIPAKFKAINPKSTQEELDKLASLCQRLTDHISTLHQPTIDALADYGLLTVAIQRSVAKWIEIARTTKPNTPTEVSGRGRPPKLAADIIASLLANNYETLTGKPPTVVTDGDSGRARGPYLQLVSDVFKALEVDASPNAAVRAALYHPKEKIPLKKRNKLL